MGKGEAMTIERLLKAASPEQVATLKRAFVVALHALGLVDRDDPITEMVARTIIKVGQTGIRDPIGIAEMAVKELQLP